MSCENCVKPGDKQEWKAQGKEISIAGVAAYSVGDENKAGVVVIATDVFGYNFINIRKVADKYASLAKVRVVIPNTLNDPIDASKPIDFSKFPEWLARNPVANATAIFQKTIDELRTAPYSYTKVFAVGVCYGFRNVADVAIKNPSSVQGLIGYHPSFLTAEDEPKINVPTYFNCAESDRSFPPELKAVYEKGLVKRVAGSVMTTYPDTEHGFCVRAEGEKAQKSAEEAHVNTAKWITSRLSA